MSLWAWSLLGALAWAGPTGWRHDGTGQVQGTTAPLTWTAAQARFAVPAPAAGNATPVWVDGLLCFLAEPTTVLCVDPTTGQTRWSATNDVVDALPAAEAATLRKELAGVPALKTQLDEAQRAVSSLRREARRGSEEAAAGLQGASEKLDALKRRYDALRVYLTPPELELIGYTSATPVSDGTTLYVMVGNGVVSRFSAQGKRLWSTWLGPAPVPMRGYDHGSVTSPQLVDGLLLVGHGHLQALSPTDGSVVWRHEERWTHYGTPAIVRVDGVAYAALPDGRVVRTRDGEVMVEGLGDLWYTGPVALGAQVWWVGSKGDAGRSDNARAWGWTLRSDGQGGLKADPRFSRVLADSERIYATALAYDGLLYVVTRRNHLMVLDAATGADVYDRQLGELLPGDGYQAPTAVQGAILLGCETADFLTLRPGRSFVQLSRSDLPGAARATPVFHGGMAFVRALDLLYGFGR